MRATFKFPPAYIFLIAEIPPAVVKLPVLIELESIVEVNAILATEKVPPTVKLFPIKADFVIPKPPSDVILPVFPLVESIVLFDAV